MPSACRCAESAETALAKRVVQKIVGGNDIYRSLHLILIRKRGYGLISMGDLSDIETRAAQHLASPSAFPAVRTAELAICPIAKQLELFRPAIIYGGVFLCCKLSRDQSNLQTSHSVRLCSSSMPFMFLLHGLETKSSYNSTTNG